MSWTSLLADRTVQSHKTSHREIDSLRELVKRDLADAALDGLSDDRGFATAYNAVLQLSKMAIALAGRFAYAISANSAHRVTSASS